MELEGSCHCKAVYFSLVTHTPLPYQHCYCKYYHVSAAIAEAMANVAFQLRCGRQICKWLRVPNIKARLCHAQALSAARRRAPPARRSTWAQMHRL